MNEMSQSQGLASGWGQEALSPQIDMGQVLTSVLQNAINAKMNQTRLGGTLNAMNGGQLNFANPREAFQHLVASMQTGPGGRAHNGFFGGLVQGATGGAIGGEGR